jgi:hypothetical protein
VKFSASDNQLKLRRRDSPSGKNFLDEMGREFRFQAISHFHIAIQYGMKMNISIDYNVSLNGKYE